MTFQRQAGLSIVELMVALVLATPVDGWSVPDF